ncbi:MAG: RNA-binding protein S1, partial [Clostridiales bacterium]
HAYVKDINDCMKENDLVRVKILSIDGNKIALSIKQAIVMEAPAPRHAPVVQGCENSFEDKLARFMKDSNEKQVTLKKHQEGRKGR